MMKHDELRRKQCDNCKYYFAQPHPNCTWCHARFNRIRTKPTNKCDDYEPMEDDK